MLFLSSRSRAARFDTRALGLVVLMAAPQAGGTQSCDPTQPPPPPPPPAAYPALQKAVDDIHAEGITGVLGVAADGDTVYRAGAGTTELDGSEPVDTTGYFRIGSGTKTYVAIVLLQLVGEGFLDLDDTLDEWLPGVVSGNGHDASAITIRMLMQHTSGIPDYVNKLPVVMSESGYAQNKLRSYAPEELVAIGVADKPAFEPGTGWAYSNTDYILLGMIIERATGRHWSDEVRIRILERLHLTETSEPGDDPELPEPHAEGYLEYPLAFFSPPTNVTVMNQTMADAAGSIISTADDQIKFWRAFAEGRLLQPAEMQATKETVLAFSIPYQIALPGMRYGLGIVYVPDDCGGGYWGHPGDTLGYSMRIAVSEDGSRVAVVSQSKVPSNTLTTIATMHIVDEFFKQFVCAGSIP